VLGVVRGHWGVVCGRRVIVCGRWARSGCWALFVGGGFSFVVLGLVRVQCTFVGGGVLFVGAGFSFVGVVVLCRVVTVSEIRWDVVLTDDTNKNDERQ
jgi:hypothetical protein